MNHLALSFISAILIGLGATLTSDLWALFLKYALESFLKFISDFVEFPV
jgi:hypothetical protein